MKSLHPSLSFSVVLSLVLAIGMSNCDLVGQDKKSEAPKGEPAKSDDTKTESKASTSASSDGYLELMNEFKTKEDKLKAMEAEYVVVGQARKNEIRVEYNKVLEEVEKLVVDLRAKAIETYEKNPNQDESLVRLLVGMLTDDLQKRKFQEFFELGDVLIKCKCDMKHFKALHSAKRLVAFGTDYYIDELIARYEDAQKGDLPRAVIETTHGDIEIELFEESAPNHVANFISLASKKFYDGSKWHRVDKVQNVVQGGQPKDGKDIDYTLAGEWDNPKRRRHFTGNVGAARTTDPNSASSQFYFVTDRVPEFDVPGNSYTVFGRVISGMEYVNQIKKDEEMISVKIIRKRDHEYVPKPYDPNAAPANPGEKGNPGEKEAPKGNPEGKGSKGEADKGDPAKKTSGDPKQEKKSSEGKTGDNKTGGGKKSESGKSESSKK